MRIDKGRKFRRRCWPSTIERLNCCLRSLFPYLFYVWFIAEANSPKLVNIIANCLTIVCYCEYFVLFCSSKRRKIVSLWWLAQIQKKSVFFSSKIFIFISFSHHWMFFMSFFFQSSNILQFSCFLKLFSNIYIKILSNQLIIHKKWRNWNQKNKRKGIFRLSFKIYFQFIHK